MPRLHASEVVPMKLTAIPLEVDAQCFWSAVVPNLPIAVHNKSPVIANTAFVAARDA